MKGAKTMKKFLSVILALLMVATMLPMAILPASAASTPTPYDGVPVTPQKISSGNYVKFGLTADNWSSYNGYYGIRTAAEFYGFAALVNGSKNIRNAVLLQDIVVNETVSASGAAYSWTPIGNSGKPYLGTFDGNGYTISGIYINGSGDNVGLFGVAGYCTNVLAESTAVIKNVILSDSYIKGNQNVAGIVGRLDGSHVTVSKCKVDSSVSVYATHASEPYVGGITGGFGQAMFGASSVCTVSDCVNFATVKAVNADNYVGAVVGYWRTYTNAKELVVCNNCYYLAGSATDKNGAVMDGTGGYGDIHNWCTALSSVSDSHTCVSADHKEVKATCQYPGRAAYSECLICGKVTSGEKTDYAIADHGFTVATCTTPATCIYCGLTDGSKDASNHASDGTAYQLNGTDDKRHDQYHTCCKAIIKTEKHSFSGTTCTVCNYKCTHSEMETGVCPNCGLSGTPYLKPVWNEKTKTVENSVELTGSAPRTFVDSDTLTNGWYIVNGNQSIYDFSTSGTVNLILADGAHLEVKARVEVARGSTLNIYAQSNDPSVMGKMTVTSPSSNMAAALGGDYQSAAGTINIYGGMISAESKGDGAAIGRGEGGSRGYLTVHGGIVTASSIRVTSMTVNGGIVLSASTGGGVNKTNGLYFNGANGVLCGDLYTLPHDWTLPAGKTLTINEGETLIVPAGLTLTIEGSIINNGTIQRYGTVICKSSHGYSGDCDVSCNNCGEARNSDAAHSWVEATCLVPKYCSVCRLVEGFSTNHNYENGICTFCGQDEIGHFYISTAKQLMDFADFVNKGNVNTNATLMADIDLAEYTWTPIGVTAMGEGVTNGYTGHFDGNGHVIRNVTFATPASAKAAGIFGTVQYGGTVRNLGVENLNFDDNTYDHRAGGIAGQLLADSTISDCYVRNSTVKASSRVVGGIVGMNYGTVKNCYTCNMTLAGFNNRFGGISGDFSAGKLENCYTDYSALASSQAGTTANCKAGVSADVFASGEIAYLLSGSTSEGDLVWGQLIGTDSYPVFGGETVYYNETNGYYNILHTCDFSGEWKYDAQKHWKECTADSCDKISEEADHSFTDGKCDCGYTCPHSSYTDGVCDTCDYECPHYYGEGVLTRPERITTTEWDDGFYTYTCSACDHYYQETVKRADYAAYDAVSDDYYAIIMNSSVLGSVKDALKDAVDNLYQNHADVMAGDRIESEQEAVDKVVAEFEKLVSDAEEKIASGEYLKADYTAIDEAIADIEQKFVDENVTDEAKAGLDEIKTQLAAMKADENTSKADLAELEKALGDYEAELDKGIEDGTLVKFSGERVFLAFVEEAEKKIDEQFGENAFYDFANANRDSFYNLYDKYFFRAAALEGGTMAENAENIEYIKGMVDELFGMVANCLDGTHNYGEGELTRPTFESKGYYTYTCTLCGHSYTVPTEKADDTALYDASMKVMEYIDNNTLTQEAKDEIYKSYRDIQENNGNVFDELGFVRGDLIEEDQPVIDAVTEALQKIIADADEKIASGEYVKADYTEINKAIKEIEDKFFYEDVTDEGKAGLEEIKKQLEEMKADENTSAADVAELEKALEDYEEELDKGIEDGTLVMVDGDKIAVESNKKFAEKLEAEGLTDEYEDFIYNQKATDEAFAAEKEMIDFANSLEGTVAENAENIAKLNEMLDSLYSSFENCLRGTHNFKDYEITSPAKCEVNAIETGTCWFCGETDEREVEGSALEHSFTKYEEIEAPKCGVAGKEISYCDNGCGATDEKEIAALEHIFLDYVSNGDATCTADGTKTAECANGCGKKDTVEDEGSMLEHVDEDGDDLCDECGEDMHVSVADCECTCHRKDVLNQFFYKIIQLIRKLFGINSTCECGTVHTSGLTPIWKIIVLK